MKCKTTESVQEKLKAASRVLVMRRGAAGMDGTGGLGGTSVVVWQPGPSSNPALPAGTRTLEASDPPCRVLSHTNAALEVKTGREEKFCQIRTELPRETWAYFSKVATS